MIFGHQLAEETQKMAAAYQHLSEELGTLEGQYAVEWLECRKSTNTDKETDRVMSASVSGRRMSVLKNTLKGLEKVMSSNKAMLRVLEMEAKNII